MSGTADLWRLDAATLATLIRNGVVSAREATAAALARLDEVNPALNAVVRPLHAEAMAAADAADRRRATGEALPPLHGVPITIKVNIDQAGHPTDGGVVAYRDNVATQDNPVVANLRRAGGIVIGRTNTPCYSMRYDTDNALHGRTRNPWSAAHTPGGSSGGAGSAVASGIGAIAHGNDIAGSVRYPAYCNGVLGLRPTYGRIPSFNATAQGRATISASLMAVQGPLTRSVADMRLAFAAMAVPDPRDPRCVDPAPFAPPTRPLRVALIAEPEGCPTAPAIAAAVRRAGAALAAAGYQVEEVAPPGFAEAAALWPKLAQGDVIAQLRPLAEKNGDDGIRKALKFWSEVWGDGSAEDTLAALGDRARLLRLWQDFFERHPLIVMPVSGDQAFLNDADIASAEATAQLLARQTPMLAVSVLGLPGLSVPTGVADGLPTGVQLVAGRYREDICFDAAEVIEAHVGPMVPIDPRG
ncbi:MAG: amidase [Alphaproteobacteria bacterium]|jgi:amidase|nr:amidase [Alphaproteobacteria bacterium]